MDTNADIIDVDDSLTHRRFIRLVQFIFQLIFFAKYLVQICEI